MTKSRGNESPASQQSHCDAFKEQPIPLLGMVFPALFCVDVKKPRPMQGEAFMLCGTVPLNESA